MLLSKRILWLLLAATLVIGSCSSDDDDNDDNNNNPPPSSDNASGAVTSDESETITTPGGAQIIVPEGAVPRFENGDPATVVFSIERDDDAETSLPSGHTAATPTYRFGPEGMILARAVEISIPLNDGVDAEDMHMIRMNPTTNEPEIMPSRYDADRNAIVSQTISMSVWFGSFVEPLPTGWGCVHVENVSTSWYTFCVDSFILEYPELDLQYMPEFESGGVWAPSGHGPGISNMSDFRMPQGTYWICEQFGSDTETPEYSNGRDSFVVADPWIEGMSSSLCTQNFVTASEGPDSGRCMCSPTPSIPVGTGAVQVTLTWFNDQALDLDLYVEDPTGEICYYGNPASSTGGVLDRDNLCGNYENGRPENIYWLSDPPVGEYIVTVDWYSDCGNGLTSQAIQVRAVVQDNVSTEDATIQNGENIEVMRFTVSSTGTIEFLPPQRGPRMAVHDGEKKAN